MGMDQHENISTFLHSSVKNYETDHLADNDNITPENSKPVAYRFNPFAGPHCYFK